MPRRRMLGIKSRAENPTSGTEKPDQVTGPPTTLGLFEGDAGENDRRDNEDDRQSGRR